MLSFYKFCFAYLHRWFNVDCEDKQLINVTGDVPFGPPTDDERNGKDVLEEEDSDEAHAELESYTHTAPRKEDHVSRG